MFFSHLKRERKKTTSKAEKHAARRTEAFFFLKPCLRKKMSRMFKDIKILRVTMCCTVIRL